MLLQATMSMALPQQMDVVGYMEKGCRFIHMRHGTWDACKYHLSLCAQFNNGRLDEVDGKGLVADLFIIISIENMAVCSQNENYNFQKTICMN